MKSKIPVIEINRENCSTFAPFLNLTIKNATFVALDCEMSGLGDRRKLNSKSVDERYEALCDAVSTRSILSIGVSCFSLIPSKNFHNDDPQKLQDDQQRRKIKMSVVTFNILTLCNENFVVEPKALEFLTKHGFDFNRQYGKGILYSPGGDKGSAKSSTKSAAFCLRDFFMRLISVKKPLILHNSLVDLVFLYQHFYGPAPKSLQTFLADLYELFPAGIYDTKYVADYCAHSKASYLEYLFRKCQRENSLSKPNRIHLSIRIPKFPDFAYQYVEWSQCSVCTDKTFDPDLHRICSSFALHGCCNDEKCALIHDVDLVLLEEEAKLERKRNKNAKKQQKPDISVENGKTESTMMNGLISLLNKRRLELLESESLESNSSKKKKKRRKISEEDGSVTIDGHFQDLESNGLDYPMASTSSNPDGHSEMITNDQMSKFHSAFYTGAHRAGFDAFMTGYCIAYYCADLYGWTGGIGAEVDQGAQNDQIGGQADLSVQNGHYADGQNNHHSVQFCVDQVKNKIALSGKDFFLTVQASAFAKTSTYHNEKIQRYLAFKE